MNYLKLFGFFFLFITIIGTTTIADSTANNDKEYKVAIVYSKNLSDYLDNRKEKDKVGYIQKLAPKAVVKTYFMNVDATTPVNIIKDRAGKIYKKITAFDPDLIIMYNEPAFEYYGIPYVYDKGKSNAMFMCLNKLDFDALVAEYKLDNPKYKGLIYGTVTDLSLSFINKLDEDNTLFSNIYILTGGSQTYTNTGFIVQDIRKAFPDRNITVYNADNTKELKNILSDLNSRPAGLLINLIEMPTDYTSGRPVRDKELAQIYIKYNIKHLSISVGDNFSKYGLAMSYINYTPAELSMSDDTSCNTFIRKSIIGEPFPRVVIAKSGTLILNKKRIDQLALTKIYNLELPNKTILVD